jgi:hypothetical protein
MSKKSFVKIQLIKVTDTFCTGSVSGTPQQVLVLKFITDTHEYITFVEFCKLCDTHNAKYSKIILSLSDMLGKIPFPFYWECAPIKAVSDPMHIYLVKADNFDVRKADISAFKNQITAKNQHDLALHFASASGSSELIIPNPMKSEHAPKFTHIRNFMRYGDDKMRLAFWSTVTQAAQQFLKKNGIVYLKTHGHGIDYFHFRLQKTNAYYVLKNTQL